jgi:hypothetical protein
MSSRGDCQEIKRLFAKLQKEEGARPAPFDGRTQPYAELTVHQYGQRIDTWFSQLREHYVECVFKPGDIGAVVDAKTGELQKVKNHGQCQEAKLQHGWHVRKLDGTPFTSKLLKQYEEGARDYVVTVEKHVSDVQTVLDGWDQSGFHVQDRTNMVSRRLDAREA